MANQPVEKGTVPLRHSEFRGPNECSQRDCPLFQQAANRQHHWYRFSLKSLLVVMTVAILAFGGWVQYMRHRARVNRERVAAVQEAVAKIEESGGKAWLVWGIQRAEYETLRPQTWLEKLFDDPGGPDDPVGVLKVTEVELTSYSTANGDRFTDADLEQIGVLKNLQSLDLDLCPITDAGLIHLREFVDLQTLSLVCRDVSGDGLKHLKGLTKLEKLDLACTKVGDGGLEHLEGMSSLQDLNLSCTDISDAGLKHLKRLKSLRTLKLPMTNVTDAGLEHLKGLTKLTYLMAWDTEVSHEGAKKTLPNCEVDL